MTRRVVRKAHILSVVTLLVVIVVITAVATLLWASLPARRAAKLDVLRAVEQD